MVSLIVVLALIGVGLGTYFSAFILVPASVLGLIIVGVVGAIEAVDTFDIIVTMIAGATVLHLGYLAGSFVHIIVVGNVDDWPDEKQAGVPHKLALGSDRSHGH
jgi:hypothetical protein